MSRSLLGLLVAGLVFTGCQKKPPASDPLGGAPRGDSVAVAVVPAPASTEEEQAAQLIKDNFRRVHFGYDSATLDASARELLAANAALLKKYTDLRVEVQGHCDERGTTDYNLALGQARARAVARQLESLGVSSGRLTVISLGEEQPLTSSTSESAYAQNRRAEFRVVVGGDGVVEGSLE